ncbi:hypothetical protein BJY04DRAFT_223027 [Aspergillus karnatakaensis]|uniref:Zn(II)2Cys6 transcription factor n=1 Tax=Aspergillus karnatakaensis TaxID=1810916 RepID=UPI003CCDA3F9
MAGRTTQACDACRYRKVKCENHKFPCLQCAHLNLSCTFSAAPASNKTRRRGHLVAQLRTRQAPPAIHYHASSISSALTLQPSPVTFFLDLLPHFTQFVYPLNPIIPPREIQNSITSMNNNADDAALVYASAAVTINRRHTYLTSHAEFAGLMTDLISRSLKAFREGGDCVLGPLPVNIKRVMTCIFLGICMTPFGQLDRCFAIVREGITMLQTLDIHKWKTRGSAESLCEVARWQRLYWEAYIHERALAMTPSFPRVLPPLETGLPVADPSIPAHIDVGFRRLIHLFLVQDDAFFVHWGAQHRPEEPAPKMTAHWVEHKQAQLDNDEAGTAQEADLVITRIWLRTLIWQLALGQGLLPSTPSRSPEESLSFHFPVDRLSSELRNLVDHLESVVSVGAHGHGIRQKLFDIISTVADVLALPLGPGHLEQSTVGRADDFVTVATFMLRFEGTTKEQRDYIQDKIQALQEIYTSVDFSAVMSP